MQEGTGSDSQQHTQTCSTKTKKCFPCLVAQLSPQQKLEHPRAIITILKVFDHYVILRIGKLVVKYKVSIFNA